MTPTPNLPAPEDGGPAYPTLWNCAHNSDWVNDGGMSLRDYFAGQALPAIIAATSAGQHTLTLEENSAEGVNQAIARDAYGVADALLSARKSGERT